MCHQFPKAADVLTDGAKVDRADNVDENGFAAKVLISQLPDRDFPEMVVAGGEQDVEVGLAGLTDKERQGYGHAEVDGPVNAWQQ